MQEPVPAGYSEGAGAAPPFCEYVADINVLNYVFPETHARLRAAIHYKASAHMESGRLNELPVIGLVGVGMYGTSIAPLNVSLTTDGCDAPVLDIYGSHDVSAVNTAVARKTAYEGSGIDRVITRVALTCDPLLSTDQCHRLEGLKGSSNSPLELEVSGWIAGL